MEPAQKIREFVEDNLIAFEDDVVLNNGDNIFELGFVDSLFALQLVSFIEGEFEIEFTNEDLDISNFSSVTAIVQFISKKKNM